MADLGLTSDFSRIADRYDATRRLPERCLVELYDRLAQSGVLPSGSAVLDAGSGTGQISLPLAARGYRVLGIDVSADMVQIARSKVLPGWSARYEVGDVRRLPMVNRSFDAAVVSKLFQHIRDWKTACRELIRVVRPGSYVVHIGERGAFGNAVRRHFSASADKLGYMDRFLGVDPHSFDELRAFMASEGCHVERVDTAGLQWDAPISYGAAYNQLVDRLHAEFWYLPPDVHDQLLRETAEWIDGQPEGQDTTDNLKPYLVAETFQTPASADGRASLRPDEARR